MTKRAIYIGYDPREAEAFAVCRESIKRRLNLPIPIYGLVLEDLKKRGMFWRLQERRDGQLWDMISEAPCATEFSISRFLVPHLAQTGQALFMDCDMLARANLWELFDACDNSKAVWCVQHKHEPTNTVKMDNQIQTRYARKNWSSVMMFNLDHPGNKRLTPHMVNSLPGRDLHRFCWLDDDEIGELGPEWNFLVGHTKPTVDPKIVHFTDGVPCMPGYENVAYADEWRRERNQWAA